MSVSPFLETMETATIQELSVVSNSTSTSENVGHNFSATTPLRIFAMLLLTLTILLVMLLNPLMLFTLGHVTSIQPTTKVFMASLTLSDLGHGITHFVTLVELFAGSWLLGDFLCVVYVVLLFVFVEMNCVSLLLLTVDRYIAITHPLRYPSMMTEFRSKIIVCIAWVGTFSISILLYGITG